MEVKNNINDEVEIPPVFEYPTGRKSVDYRTIFLDEEKKKPLTKDILKAILNISPDWTFGFLNAGDYGLNQARVKTQLNMIRQEGVAMTSLPVFPWFDMLVSPTRFMLEYEYDIPPPFEFIPAFYELEVHLTARVLSEGALKQNIIYLNKSPGKDAKPLANKLEKLWRVATKGFRAASEEQANIFRTVKQHIPPNTAINQYIRNCVGAETLLEWVRIQEEYYHKIRGLEREAESMIETGKESEYVAFITEHHYAAFGKNSDYQKLLLKVEKRPMTLYLRIGTKEDVSAAIWDDFEKHVEVITKHYNIHMEMIEKAKQANLTGELPPHPILKRQHPGLDDGDERMEG